MAERAGLSKEYEQNFVLDEARLRKLVSVYEDFARRLNKETYIIFYVGRENSSYYETQSIDEVLSDPNSPGKAIQALAIELKHKNPPEDQKHIPEDDRRPIAFMAFNRLKDLRIRFGVTGQDRDWCFLFADELDSQVKRLLRGKINRFIPKRNADKIVFCLITGLFFLAAVLIVSHTPAALEPVSSHTMTPDQKLDTILLLLAKRGLRNMWPLPLVLVIAGAMLWIMELRPFGRILEKLSQSVFYWGNMVPIWNRQQSRITTIKWIIVAGFIISLLSTIVGGYLMGQKIQLP
jgi:hypothetical protein